MSLIIGSKSRNYFKLYFNAFSCFCKKLHISNCYLIIKSLAKSSCDGHFLLAAGLGNEYFVKYVKSHVLLMKWLC